MWCVSVPLYRAGSLCCCSSSMLIVTLRPCLLCVFGLAAAALLNCLWSLLRVLLLLLLPAAHEWRL